MHRLGAKVPTAPADQTCRYAVDAGDVITTVGGAWDEFALANGAPGLAAKSVVGQPLLAYFAGPELVHLTRLLMRHVRATQAPLAIPLRCDSPSQRRFLHLEILPLPDGGLEFRSRIVRVEDRPPIALLDPAAPRRDEMLAICSYCKRVRAPDGRWLALDEAAGRLELLAGERQPRLSHGVCLHCGTAVRSRL